MIHDVIRRSEHEQLGFNLPSGFENVAHSNDVRFEHVTPGSVDVLTGCEMNDGVLIVECGSNGFVVGLVGDVRVEPSVGMIRRPV
jgi:hypothetical protein